MSKEEVVAERYRRNGTVDWKRWGSATAHFRYFELVDSRSRRRCPCGCKRRATHRGMANGICLVIGCEMSVARWSKDLGNYLRTHAASMRNAKGSDNG